MDGINRATDEKGFLLLDNFKNKIEDNTAEILNDKLYKSPLEAFHSGYNKLAGLVDDDFRLYLEDKKKKNREIEKLPRKIIRDFIKACNSSDEINILKSLDVDVIFEKRKNWKTIFEAEGILKFKEYLSFPDQQLCGKNFKIRSSWSFSLPNVTIGVKYLPRSTEQDKQPTQKYEQFKFIFKDNKIIGILYEC